LRALFIALAVLIACGNHPAEAKKATVPGWEIEQKIYKWGHVRMTVCAEGALFLDIERGYNVTMRPPDWKLVYYSDSRKVIAELPLSKLRTTVSDRVRLFVGGDKQDINPVQWKLHGDSLIAGIPVQLYTLDFAADKESDHVRTWKDYVVKKIQLPPAATTFMCKSFGMVDLGKYPLRFQTGRVILDSLVDTVSMRPKAIDQDIFKSPVNYQKVTPEQVIFAVQDFPLEEH
jgi:hypothetical protein